MSNLIVSLRDNISKKFIGKESVIDNLMVALLANGHVLIDDVPGVGKTTLAKCLAKSIDSSLGRIQFTPDTLPTDVVGMSVYNPQTMEFKLVKGPVHNSIVLADEINRTSPRTQSALLEAMEERQVTIDGKSYDLPELFMVIATENPSEQIGTYPLPEAELDRFMLKLKIGYPDSEMQLKLAKNYLEGKLDEDIKPVIKEADVIKMKNEVKSLIMSDEVIEYALKIVDSTRQIEEVEYGLSPRASLDLLMASKANAYISGRDFVIPDDVIAMSKLVLPHRLVLTAKARIDKYTGSRLINRVLENVVRPK